MPDLRRLQNDPSEFRRHLLPDMRDLVKGFDAIKDAEKASAIEPPEPIGEGGMRIDGIAVIIEPEPVACVGSGHLDHLMVECVVKSRP